MGEGVIQRTKPMVCALALILFTFWMSLKNMIVYKTKQNCPIRKLTNALICKLLIVVTMKFTVKYSLLSGIVCAGGLYWFPSQGATMLFLAGTFRLSSVASDFRFSAEIGNERGTSRLLFRLGSPAFIDLVRPGSSERLLVCPGESPLKNRMLFYVDIHTKRTYIHVQVWK